MTHKERRKRRLRKFSDTLWVWRDYELTLTTFLGSPMYILARNGGTKPLIGSTESFQAGSIWEMQQFLSDNLPQFNWNP